ncbi:MAG: hypothetical protein J6K21_03580 [Bacilli bacterium]|nr:hypothetical protein [Bacilli bacterium]
MKKVLNKNLILGILIGLPFSIVSVYAATTYLASNIKYKDTTVESALNDLYNKSNNCTTGSFNHIGGNEPIWNIEIGFKPSKFTIFSYTSSKQMFYSFNYNNNISEKIIGSAYYNNGNDDKATDYSSMFELNNNGIIFNGISSWYIMTYDTSVNWIACQ